MVSMRSGTATFSAAHGRELDPDLVDVAIWTNLWADRFGMYDWEFLGQGLKYPTLLEDIGGCQFGINWANVRSLSWESTDRES